MRDVACRAANTEACPIFQLEGECYEDTHHVYWPANEYTTRTEKQFRQLDKAKIEICRWIHNELHEVTLPPAHPTVTQMRKAINEER